MAERAGTEASEEAAASIAVELIAVLVAVADGRPLDDDHRRRAGAAFGAVRGRASVAAIGPARLGRAADPPSARLCRAALHLRRFGPARRGGRRAGHLDQLSRPDARGARPGAARGVASLVRLFPLGGSSLRRAGADRTHDRAGARGLGGKRRRPDRAPRARRDRLRARGARLERGTRPPALRASVRGGARSRGAATEAGARGPRRSAGR